MRRFIGGILLAGLLVPMIGSGQEAGFTSGPQPAPKGKPPTKMAHSFEAHVFNGKFANRFHCLVTENDFYPTVMMFVKDPGEGKDAAIKSLMAKLEEIVPKYQAMEKYPEVTGFSILAVFLDDRAQTSLVKPDEPDPAALVKEATERRTLYGRMNEWAKDRKNASIACATLDRAKGYKINPSAELTVVYFDSFNVLENFAYEAGGFTEEKVAAVAEKVEGRLQAIIAGLEAKRKRQ